MRVTEEMGSVRIDARACEYLGRGCQLTPRDYCLGKKWEDKECYVVKKSSEQNASEMNNLLLIEGSTLRIGDSK